MINGNRKTIYSWGKQARDFEPVFGAASKDLLLLDKEWIKLDVTGRVIWKKANDYPEVSGAISPDGKMIAGFSNGDLYIYNIESRLKSVKWSVDGEIHAIQWANDSTRLAVVTTNYKDADHIIFDYDVLTVLSVN